MLKETNTPTRPRIEPGSPDPESDALTIRPVRPPQGGCERRIKVFVKIQKKKKKFGGGGWGGFRWGSYWWGGWVRMDVNAMFGVGGDVGYGGCEPRVEGIVQGSKRYCTILRK